MSLGARTRGTTRISGSLSCGAREVRSPCACPGLEAQFPARRREERGCGPVTGKDRASCCLGSWTLNSRFLCNIALYSIRLYFHHQSHPHLDVVFVLSLSFQPQGSPASSSVWREDPGLLSRPCRKRRPTSRDDGAVSWARLGPPT